MNGAKAWENIPRIKFDEFHSSIVSNMNYISPIWNKIKLRGKSSIQKAI
jgi:hypothetical protein